MVETLLDPVTEFALSRDQPFPGLRPYGEEDASWFFGRSGEINELLKRLRRLHFVAIVGASGSGKSSLVRAGVLPQIRDGYLDADWQIAAFRPGEQPLANLAAALDFPTSVSSEDPAAMLRTGPMGLVRALQMSRQPRNSRLLILVDQFEELFQFAQRTGDSAQEEIKEFLKLLLTAASSDEVAVYVVVTMRLEWMSECAGYAGLADAINEGIYLVPQMQRRQFGQAILGPLEAAGGGLTSALLDRMLNDLDNRSDQLPVLQHALLRLWERTGVREPFGLADYEAVGTFSNCLSAHAEEVYAELTPREQHIAELLFRAITQVNKGRKIRRPRPVSEILLTAKAKFRELDTVVRAFSKPGRSFLVTTQGALMPASIVDISHEALIRQWTRLSDWVDSEAELQTRLRRLEEDAAEWDRDRAGSKACLYTGSRLVRAEELQSALGTSSTAVAFLRESARARFLATVRKRSWMVAVPALVVAVAFAFAIVNRRHAMESKALAMQADNYRRLAEIQSQKDQEFRANFVHQIEAAKGSATALAEIAQTIQAQRVYVQYAAGGKLLAKTVQGQLQRKGFAVAGAEQMASDHVPAETQVRYFYDKDGSDAQRIAGLLKPLVPTTIAVQKLANPKDLIPQGQFEVWLSPGAAAAQPAEVAGTKTQTAKAENQLLTPSPVVNGCTATDSSMCPPVLAMPPPKITAISSEERVQQGREVTLSWRTENASAVEISGFGKVEANGSRVLRPQRSAIYSFVANGDGGATALASVKIEVIPAVAPPTATADVTPSEPIAVKAALTRYKEAYESESLDDVKKAWPSVSKAQQKNMKMAFDQFNAIRLNLNCRDEAIHVEGDTASATCQQTAVYTLKGKKQPEQVTSSTFHLKKAGAGWVVDGVQ